MFLSTSLSFLPSKEGNASNFSVVPRPALGRGIGRTLCSVARGGGGGGLKSGIIKSNCEKLREIVGNLRCPNQTPRSLKVQHFCTGDTQGTNKHTKWTSKQQIAAKLRENCGKIAKNCEKWRNCEKLRGLNPPYRDVWCAGHRWQAYVSTTKAPPSVARASVALLPYHQHNRLHTTIRPPPTTRSKPQTMRNRTNLQHLCPPVPHERGGACPTSSHVIVPDRSTGWAWGILFGAKPRNSPPKKGMMLGPNGPKAGPFFRTPVQFTHPRSRVAPLSTAPITKKTPDPRAGKRPGLLLRGPAPPAPPPPPRWC